MRFPSTPLPSVNPYTMCSAIHRINIALSVRAKYNGQGHVCMVWYLVCNPESLYSCTHAYIHRCVYVNSKGNMCTEYNIPSADSESSSGSISFHFICWTHRPSSATLSNHIAQYITRRRRTRPRERARASPIYLLKVLFCNSLYSVKSCMCVCVLEYICGSLWYTISAGFCFIYKSAQKLRRTQYIHKRT